MLVDAKEKITRKAEELGLDIVGFSQAKILEGVKACLELRQRENRSTTLECPDIGLRVNPERILAGVKSIITAGIAYFQPEPKGDEGLRGIVSRSAWGTDYHLVLGDKLNGLSQFIREASGHETKWFVDTGPPVDRALAVEAGLGWSGKNCALINPQFGSWVFLGQIYTTLELEADTPVQARCGECEMCLKACPSGALRKAYVIDPYRCISFLTQMKGFIPVGLRSLMGVQIYGCDRCQSVCPANRTAAEKTAPQFTPELRVVKPDLIALLQMSNKEFKSLYANSAAGWRGRTVLQRNAIIALGNLKDKRARESLTGCLGDQRAVIRGHAAWALGELGDTCVLPTLEEALGVEGDPQVVEEIRAAISRLQS